MRFTKTNPTSKTTVLLLCASFDSLAPARLALRANFRLLYLALTLALGCGELSAADDPFKDLASTLGKEAPGEKVNIAVGSFNYENTDLQSPFSSMLRDELEIALGESGKFKVVTRDRLADLQMEGKFQGKGILEPGVLDVETRLDDMGLGQEVTKATSRRVKLDSSTENLLAFNANGAGAGAGAAAPAACAGAGAQAMPPWAKSLWWKVW